MLRQPAGRRRRRAGGDVQGRGNRSIELAAARVPVLTPAEIAAHLDRRFKLLTGGRRVAMSRHQTLRNAIEWSYQLLDPNEQAVLDRLAVFAGGFDLDSAQAVAATDAVDSIDVLDIVARLVAKSLVVAEPRDGMTRFRLLETVRDFARERLQNAGEDENASRRHAVYFAEFARSAGAGLRGPQEADWRQRVELEVDNLRVALAWAIATGDVRLALEPINDLAIFGDAMAPFGLAPEAAARLAEDHPLAAVALGAACYAATLQGGTTALAATPNDLVPACSAGASSAAQEEADRKATAPGASAKFHGGSSQIVLDAALIGSAPVVTSIDPNTGPLTGGTSVVIEGSGFTAASLVTFGLVRRPRPLAGEAVSEELADAMDRQVQERLREWMGRALEHLGNDGRPSGSAGIPEGRDGVPAVETEN